MRRTDAEELEERHLRQDENRRQHAGGTSGNGPYSGLGSEGLFAIYGPEQV
jgi:hypothetical protein